MAEIGADSKKIFGCLKRSKEGGRLKESFES